MMAEIINLAEQSYRRGPTLERMLANYNSLIGNYVLRIELGERAFRGFIEEATTPRVAVLARLREAHGTIGTITELDM